MMIGWIPGRGTAAYGLVRPVGVPGTVTHYVSQGPEWERDVDVFDGNGFLQASLYAPQKPVAAGTTVRDRWFGGPLAPNASPLLAQFGWQAYPYRQGDFLWLFMPSIMDRDGHTGSAIYLDEFHGALYRNGELVTEADDPIWLSGWVPPEPADYRLVYTMRRNNAFWQRSTFSQSEWGFHSKRTPGDHAVLPLLSVDLDLPLSTLNTAPADPFSFGVGFRMPLEVAYRPVRDVTVEVSWDGGGTWQAAPLRGCTGMGCTVDVNNRTGGAASLPDHRRRHGGALDPADDPRRLRRAVRRGPEGASPGGRAGGGWMRIRRHQPGRPSSGGGAPPGRERVLDPAQRGASPG